MASIPALAKLLKALGTVQALCDKIIQICIVMEGWGVQLSKPSNAEVHGAKRFKNPYILPNNY